jgi:hypothetical protein
VAAVEGGGASGPGADDGVSGLALGGDGGRAEGAAVPVDDAASEGLAAGAEALALGVGGEVGVLP